MKNPLKKIFKNKKVKPKVNGSRIKALAELNSDLESITSITSKDSKDLEQQKPIEELIETAENALADAAIASKETDDMLSKISESASIETTKTIVPENLSSNTIITDPLANNPNKNLKDRSKIFFDPTSVADFELATDILDREENQNKLRKTKGGTINWAEHNDDLNGEKNQNNEEQTFTDSTISANSDNTPVEQNTDTKTTEEWPYDEISKDKETKMSQNSQSENKEDLNVPFDEKIEDDISSTSIKKSSITPIQQKSKNHIKEETIPINSKPYENLSDEDLQKIDEMLYNEFDTDEAKKVKLTRPVEKPKTNPRGAEHLTDSQIPLADPIKEIDTITTNGANNKEELETDAQSVNSDFSSITEGTYNSNNHSGDYSDASWHQPDEGITEKPPQVKSKKRKGILGFIPRIIKGIFSPNQNNATRQQNINSENSVRTKSIASYEESTSASLSSEADMSREGITSVGRGIQPNEIDQKTQNGDEQISAPFTKDKESTDEFSITTKPKEDERSVKTPQKRSTSDIPTEIFVRTKTNQNHELESNPRKKDKTIPDPDQQNEETDSTISTKYYDKEAAKEASKELATQILEKYKNRDHSATPITDISKHTHVVESLKKLGENSGENIKVNINFESDFAEIQEDLLSNTYGDQALKDFVIDISKGDKITFATEESKKQFIEAASKYSDEINIDKIKEKIEPKNSFLEKSEGLARGATNEHQKPKRRDNNAESSSHITKHEPAKRRKSFGP